MDVDRRLASDSRVVIPLGANEEHGYLSLCTDTLFVEEVCRQACERANVLLMPALPFGCSAFAARYPGTISLRTSTMGEIVQDIVTSLYTQGFRRLIFVTGHGGNEAVPGRLSELALDCPALVVHYRSAWAGMWPEVVRTAKERGWAAPEHAGWHENFAFTRVASSPAIPSARENAFPFPDSPDFPIFPLNPRLARTFLPEGIVRGPAAIDDDEFMTALLEAAVAELASFLTSQPRSRPVR